jgi:hypothetical protein
MRISRCIAKRACRDTSPVLKEGTEMAKMTVKCVRGLQPMKELVLKKLQEH